MGISLEEKVLNFIHSRFPVDCRWTDGNCYYFAVILKDAFKGEIYYDEVDGHFITLIDDKYYDWTGVVEVNSDYISRWETLQLVEPLRAERIIRDCL